MLINQKNFLNNKIVKYDILNILKIKYRGVIWNVISLEKKIKMILIFFSKLITFHINKLENGTTNISIPDTVYCTKCGRKI